jgi:hypothetical protein
MGHDPNCSAEVVPLGDVLELLEWSVVNSTSLKWMASSWMSFTPNKRMLPVVTVGLHR